MGNAAAWAAHLNKCLEQAAEWQPPQMQKPGTNKTVLCLECGETIPEARRRAIPSADYCVECQEDLDKASKATYKTCSLGNNAEAELYYRFRAASPRHRIKD